MAYVGSIITVWIVLAVIFGFTLGWLARGRKKGAKPKGRTMKFR